MVCITATDDCENLITSTSQNYWQIFALVEVQIATNLCKTRNSRKYQDGSIQLPIVIPPVYVRELDLGSTLYSAVD